MNQKKFQKLSVVALIISLLPLVTFIPVLLHITLTDGVRSAWAGVNIFCIFVGLIISVTLNEKLSAKSKGFLIH